MLDASIVVAALVDAGSVGSWADSVLLESGLAAPHLMPVEAANILRRSAAAGETAADTAALAHADLLQLHVQLFPCAPFAARVWEMRADVTAYDAWYVALAETLDTDLVTLDLRLAAAPGHAAGSAPRRSDRSGRHSRPGRPTCRTLSSVLVRHTPCAVHCPHDRVPGPAEAVEVPCPRSARSCPRSVSPARD